MALPAHVVEWRAGGSGNDHRCGVQPRRMKCGNSHPSRETKARRMGHPAEYCWCAVESAHEERSLVTRRRKTTASARSLGMTKGFCNDMRLFQRGHVDDEAIFYVALQQALVRGVDLLDGNHFDVGGDAVIGAEVEHLLRFADTTDG